MNVETAGIFLKVSPAAKDEIGEYRQVVVERLSQYGLTELRVAWPAESNEIEIEFNVPSCFVDQALDSCQSILSERANANQDYPTTSAQFLLRDPELGTFHRHHDIYWRSTGVSVGQFKLDLEVCADVDEDTATGLEKLKEFIRGLPAAQERFIAEAVTQLYPHLLHKMVQANVGLVGEITEKDFREGLTPIEIRSWTDGTILVNYRSRNFTKNYIVTAVWAPDSGFICSLQPT